MTVNFTTIPLTYTPITGVNMEKVENIEVATAFGNEAAPVFESDGTTPSVNKFPVAAAANKTVIKGYPYKLRFTRALSTVADTVLIPS